MGWIKDLLNQIPTLSDPQCFRGDRLHCQNTRSTCKIFFCELHEMSRLKNFTNQVQALRTQLLKNRTVDGDSQQRVSLSNSVFSQMRTCCIDYVVRSQTCICEFPDVDGYVYSIYCSKQVQYFVLINNVLVQTLF